MTSARRASTTRPKVAAGLAVRARMPSGHASQLTAPPFARMSAAAAAEALSGSWAFGLPSPKRREKHDCRKPSGRRGEVAQTTRACSKPRVHAASHACRQQCARARVRPHGQAAERADGQPNVPVGRRLHHAGRQAGSKPRVEAARAMELLVATSPDTLRQDGVIARRAA